MDGRGKFRIISSLNQSRDGVAGRAASGTIERLSGKQPVRRARFNEEDTSLLCGFDFGVRLDL